MNITYSYTRVKFWLSCSMHVCECEFAHPPTHPHTESYPWRVVGYVASDIHMYTHTYFHIYTHTHTYAYAHEATQGLHTDCLHACCLCPHSHVGYDSFKCVTRLMHKGDMTQPYSRSRFIWSKD